MTQAEKIWFAVVLSIIAACVLVVVLKPAPASCDTRGCYGGLCMTSAACAPGCACIGGRCS